MQQVDPDQVRPLTPIVPPTAVDGQALMFVIAIMAFLACLTLGAVTLVDQSARGWQSQVSREATIQIRPVEGVDLDAVMADAADIAATWPGVRSVEVIDEQTAARLLEPWLGTGLDLSELPVPRLIVVTIDETRPPDFTAMRAALTETVPGASLDDHRGWIDRLVAMARATTLIGFSVLALVLAAMALTVVFATRGAMSSNQHIIEVLYFVGAEPGFIAGQFQRHFVITGLKGAAIGGALAMLVFLVSGWWASRNLATPEADQAIALFGSFAIGPIGYAGSLIIVLAIAGLTGLISRLTVIRSLHRLNMRDGDAL